MPRVTVSIPEGYTLLQIENLLKEKRVLEAGDSLSLDPRSLSGSHPFLAAAPSLEGFLFPDTYEFFIDTAPLRVVERMLGVFQTKAEPLLGGKKNALEAVTLASLIEREVKPSGRDRELVAGILLKRLAAGMPLQVDAALCYAKARGACDRVAPEDKALDSPYNTYARRGLPPAPIGNPGLDALGAALNPRESPYWYYLSAAGSGRTVFASTLDEHNQNIVNYLRISHE